MLRRFIPDHEAPALVNGAETAPAAQTLVHGEPQASSSAFECPGPARLALGAGLLWCQPAH